MTCYPCSPSFRALTLQHLPALSVSEPYRRLFFYLCFSTFRDPESGQLVLPAKVIAEDIYGQPYNDHFNALEKLQAFRRDVLPGLRWSEARFARRKGWQGKAREIIDLGIDAQLRDAVDREDHFPSKHQIDFVTGNAITRDTLCRLRSERRQLHLSDMANWQVNPTQQKILSYLSSPERNYAHLILRKVQSNAARVDDAISLLKPEVQHIQYRILAKVRQDPNIYYRPSVKRNTCRLFHEGDCLPSLKGDVRKAACHGWVECDLRSSQFAILAAKLEAPSALDLLRKGQNLWHHLYSEVCGLNGAPPAHVKKVLKTAIYSVCFGMSHRRIKKLLAADGLDRLLDVPVVRELLQRRKAWFKEIERAGGAEDAWGEWLPIVKRGMGKAPRWAGAVAASVIQSIEMDIIAPIFDVATQHGKSDQFTICFFQHDGATISFQSTAKMLRAMAKLRKAVDQRAQAHGVSTSLEFNLL